MQERDDLGFLQLITSTSSLDEVSRLLDDALNEMGLSSSPANRKLLLDSLKALSGRLALRLTNEGTTVAEMVALALVQNKCVHGKEGDEAWLSLRDGFFVPIDDVPELLQSIGDKPDQAAERADLLYVSPARKGGLRFCIVEVKFRRYLKTARSTDMLEGIDQQLAASEQRWEKLYGEETSALEKTVLRVRLARFLRFYLKKARRHTLSCAAYEQLSAELDQLARDSAGYKMAELADQSRAGLAFVLCPEYRAVIPVRIDRGDYTETWLFGPEALMPPPELTSPLPRNHEATAPPESQQPNVVKSNVAEDAYIVLAHDASSGEPVDWRLSIRGNPHLLIVGLPGMGKTSCLIQICRQLGNAGIAPIVFSYHEDIDEKLSEAFARAIRSVTFVGLGLNPMQVGGTSPLAYMDNVISLTSTMCNWGPFAKPLSKAMPVKAGLHRPVGPFQRSRRSIAY